MPVVSNAVMDDVTLFASKSIMCSMAKTHRTGPSCFDIFETKRMPSITLCEYMRRIVAYSTASQSVFFVAMRYFTRIANRHTLRRKMAHRLFLSCYIIAFKYTDDIEHIPVRRTNVYLNRNNIHEEHSFCETLYLSKWMSDVGGIREMRVLNAMEAVALKLLDYRCHIPVRTFQDYVNHYSNPQFHLPRVRTRAKTQ